MADVPDFEQIAKQVLREQGIYEDYAGELHITTALRQVWNARGAADLSALEPIIEKLGDAMDPDNARAFVGDALRELDRQ